MVQRYTRSISFQDSLKFYRAPLHRIKLRNVVMTLERDVALVRH